MERQTNRSFVTAGLLAALFIGALDSTVVTTATTSIATDLQGFGQISWIFSIYTLTTCVTTPIFGKLADLFGRKTVFIVGLGLFLAGSVLCGAAGSMSGLIWFRAIQGIGAGALTPVTFTIIGDLYKGEQRGKIQAVLSSVWSVAGLVGPFVGGYFVDAISWRWIFFMNVPVSVLSFLLVVPYLHERFLRANKRIDYGGALAFTLSVSSLLFALLTGGNEYGWDSPLIAGLFIVFAAGLLLFIRIERRAPEPMLPLSLLQDRRLSIPYAMAFLGFGMVAGVTIYIPFWIQNVLGFSATTSGLMLMPMSLFWPVASNLSGRFMYRLGAKRFMTAGAVLVLIAAGWLLTLDASDSYLQIIGALSIFGLGMGSITTPAIVMIQGAADHAHRGVATSTNSLLGALGQTVAAAFFGMLFNHVVRGQSASGSAGTFADGMHLIFIGIACVSLVHLLITTLLPSASSDGVQRQRL
ncbi:MDR family MFS transporter [Cohnella sp. 56]|uniref:MDR family MFS transporter n=1 Tax=Cohnella sp. 56 TaxID=3113722 RepID=UPI0030E7899F